MAEEEQRILLQGVWSPSPADKPPLITSQGLSLERRKYLFQKIRKYCQEDARDRVCPDPTTPSHEPLVALFTTQPKRRRILLSPLLPLCCFAICSVAVCTCGGYTAQALLIDFCLCLLKVVYVAVCTCGGYTAQALLIDFCLCLLKVVYVAVCTCGGYTAQALLIDFCLCLLKVVSVAVCTCGGYTAQAVLIDFCLCLLKVVICSSVYMWWGFVLDVMC